MSRREGNRQEGRRSIAHRGCGVDPPTHTQGYSLPTRPSGCVGNEPMALINSMMFFPYILWKYQRLDVWVTASPLKQWLLPLLIFLTKQCVPWAVRVLHIFSHWFLSESQ
jgi:hypothetical protein